MKGDFSRFTYDAAKHYIGVMHQQGRVWLDSDWNEDVLERLALQQQQISDIVGGCGVPAPGSAFQLSPSADPNAPDNFQISGGRCYLNGVLCQLESNISYLNQPDLPDPPRIPIPTDGSTLLAVVYLEAWQRLVTYLEDDSLREVALGGPDTSARLKTVAQIKFAALPSSAANITCAQAAQFIPGPGGGTLTTLQPSNAQPQTQSLCQLPDPANFTGRENHLYRVQIHDGGDVGGATGGAKFSIALVTDVAAGANAVSLALPLTAAQADTAQRSGFITISDSSGSSERVSIASIATSGSVINLGQRLQNGYKTANAATVTGGVARFKWSRDNAAFAVSVTGLSQDRTTLTLSSLGRDAATALQQGDLVEITDDATELGAARGHLTHIASGPDPDQFTVTLAEPLPTTFVVGGSTGLTSPPSSATAVADRHLVLRRWDGAGDANAVYDDAATPGMNLGDGVHVQFGGADLRPGDYWHFTARSADGSVQRLSNALPAGIVRLRSPLAIVSWGPPPHTSPPSSPPSGVAMTILQDCRKIFPSLVNFPQTDRGFHVTGLVVLDPNNTPAQLLNDTNVQITSFNGIDVHCDDNVDPASISRPTFFLTADYPLDVSSQGSAGYFRVVLAGNVSSNGNTISWRPLAQTQALLAQLIAANQNERGILTQVTLRGNFIWSQNDPTSFLDGDAFGAHQTGANNISLTLPSGDKRRGGDFGMWFWIVAAPSFATLMQADPAQIFVGATSTVTVTFSSAAPAGSAAVVISSSNPPVAKVPATIPVPTNATFVTFQVTGQAVGQTNLTAAFGGQTVAAIVTVAPLPVLTGQLTLNPAAIFVNASSTGSITLTGPAPSTGLVVTLSSNNPGVAGVAASVAVPAGSASASFNITGVAAGSATITATLSGASLQALITVRNRPKLKEKEFVVDKTELIEKARLAEKVFLGKTTQKLVIEAAKLSESAARLSGKNPDFVGKTADIGTAASAALNSSNGAGLQLPPPLNAQAFIRPEERPAVEDFVINAGGT
jgi:hypothetical protein